MSELLNVDDAVNQILAQIHEPTTEFISTIAVLGRVLAEDVVASVDLPPFPNSSMDGFAVQSADIKRVPVMLNVVMDIPAGTVASRSLKSGEAARIMTGAPLPEGADAVVPVEHTNVSFQDDDNSLTDKVEIRQTTSKGSNVRPVGENVQKGQLILPRYTVLRPQDIGMLASLGVTDVPVYKKPEVAVLSTGDELVGIDAPLTPGKIRDSNSYMIAALVTMNGGNAERFPPVKDDIDAVRERFYQAIVNKPDLIVSTAGVSVGTFDVVRTVLDELGEIGFWRVNVRPGKPLAFGRLQGIPFLGLPGNPVSAMVTFDLFVRPALLKLAGVPVESPPTKIATLAEDVRSDGRRTYMRVKLFDEGGELTATSTGTQSSGALMSMVEADGLLVIPEGQIHVKKGEQLPVRLLR